MLSPTPFEPRSTETIWLWNDATLAAALAASRARADSAGQRHGSVPPPLRAFERIASAFDARVNGRDDEAVAALTEAAELQDGLPIYGPPGVPPARELLGGLLLELGRHADAAAAFDPALLRTPNRSAALLGRGRRRGAAMRKVPGTGMGCFCETGRAPTRTSPSSRKRARALVAEARAGAGGGRAVR